MKVIRATGEESVDIGPAVAALRDGALVAFPTETVYGLGCSAVDADAVRQVFSVKGRPADDPLIVHVHPSWPLERVFDSVPVALRQLVEEFWPGPLTLVGPRNSSIPPEVTSGLPTVAVRAPDHPIALRLLAETDLPIAAPSANRFGYVSPTDAEHVIADLGDGCDFVIDGGPCIHGLESTVVAVNDGLHLTVLRHGAVTTEELRSRIPGIRVTEPATGTPASISPGRLQRHYSPNTPTLAVVKGLGAIEGFANAVSPRTGGYIGYEGAEPELPPSWQWIPVGRRSDLRAAGTELYRVLRQSDALAHDALLVELSGEEGIGHALDDRLSKSAGGNVAATISDLARWLNHLDATQNTEIDETSGHP